MSLNTTSTYFPPQPKNPTDEERHLLAYFALAQRQRGEDLPYIKALTAPPPDISTIAKPGAYKGVKVGILGGGLAGMAAAFELRKLGFDITVFDALEDRIGGRVYTYYFNNDKTLYGEFGAMRIPVTHETTWHYINKFKLNTSKFIQVNENSVIYLRDARARNDAEGISVKENIYPRFYLSPEERNKSWQELLYQGYDSHLLAARPDLRTEIIQVKPSYNPFTLYWDRMSSRNMLEQSLLSEDTINLLSYLSPLPGSFLYNSFIDYIEEPYTADLTFLYEIDGGNVNLPLAFYNSFHTDSSEDSYPDLPQEVLGKVSWRAGNWVNGIQWNGYSNKVTLLVENKAQLNTTYEEFDYVICAIPFSTLRNIDIDPQFGPGKMQAIREVYYGNSQKSLLLCKQRFWEEGNQSEQIIGGISYTDLPINQIIYPSDHAEYSSGTIKYLPNNYPAHTLCFKSDKYKALSREQGVLTIYNFHLDATRLANLTEDLRFEKIKRNIEEVHGLPTGALNEIAAEIKTVNWDTEPWFRGAFCFFTPEQKRLFSYVMACPEYGNKVFFAGEHISSKHRWMQGALQSGMQAANELALHCKNSFK